ncbi:MAG: hypothetical protein ACTH6N_04150, partial [Brachybacterium tyrofermentans]|uniref:hypothetical protein n=1 Tax=Brachybacterium tyrofermentans TaxID=47848 RepID=UPI001D0101E4
SLDYSPANPMLLPRFDTTSGRSTEIILPPHRVVFHIVLVGDQKMCRGEAIANLSSPGVVYPQWEYRGGR